MHRRVLVAIFCGVAYLAATSFAQEQRKPPKKPDRPFMVYVYTEGVAPFENILDNEDGSPEFDGHYADSAFLSVTGPAPVPEPSTMLLLGFGLAGLGFFGRRKIAA